MSSPGRLAVTPIIATKGGIGLLWDGQAALGAAVMAVALLTTWLVAREFGHRYRNRNTGD